MAIEVRPVTPDEYDEAGRVTADAYREFADSDDWERYLERSPTSAAVRRSPPSSRPWRVARSSAP